MPCRILTRYESRVDRGIAAWKVRRPPLVWRLTNSLSRSIAWVIGRLIPKAAVRALISAACTTSNCLTNPNGLMVSAGVERLSDLRFKSLELSDKMAGRISREAQFAAALQGLVTGLGGLPLVALDISALVVITLNGIQRTGQCYGYALDRPEDRPFLLAILMLAGARSLPERRDALAHLRDVRSWVLSRAIESAAIENVIKQLLNIAVLESIPGVGSVIGGAANLAFVRKALADGRRVFQERWLLESCGSAPMIEVLSSPSLAQENESCPRQLTVTKASRKLRS